MQTLTYIAVALIIILAISIIVEVAKKQGRDPINVLVFVVAVAFVIYFGGHLIMYWRG
jgi:uncharacterized membrane protein